MAWSWVDVSAVVEAASGNVTATEPAAVAADDLMVAVVGYRGTPNFALPAGWALVAQEASANTTVGGSGTTDSGAIASVLMAWIKRGGSAPDLTFTRTAGDVAEVVVNAYRNDAGSTYALDSSASVTLAVAGTASGNLPLVTSGADELLVAGAASGGSVGSAALGSFDASAGPTTASGTTASASAISATAWRLRNNNGTATGADVGLRTGDATKATAATFDCFATSLATRRHSMIVAAFTIAAAGSDRTFSAAGVGGATFLGTGAQQRQWAAPGAGAASFQGVGAVAESRTWSGAGVAAAAIAAQGAQARTWGADGLGAASFMSGREDGRTWSAAAASAAALASSAALGRTWSAAGLAQGDFGGGVAGSDQPRTFTAGGSAAAAFASGRLVGRSWGAAGLAGASIVSLQVQELASWSAAGRGGVAFVTPEPITYENGQVILTSPPGAPMWVRGMLDQIRNGFIPRYGATPHRLPGFHSLNLPAAADHPRSLIFVVDLNRVAYSDGTDWYPLTPGSPL